MDHFPAPLVPAEVDLSDFQYMELDVRLLRDSKFAAEVSAEAFRAGVLLWCAAWHQVPAGSLPNNDVELSQLAGFGRVKREWLKVKEDALSLFVPCSDGRLYHRVIAEKAIAAWEARLRHHYDRARDRLRKANKARVAEGLEALPEITFEQWDAARLAHGIPISKADAVAGIPPSKPALSAGIPAENALKGKGNGTERERRGNGDSLSEPIGSGGKPPETADLIFGLALPLLLAANVPEKNARTMLGLMRKTHGDEAVIEAVQRCAEERPLEPVAWLQGALKTRPKPGSDVAIRERNAAANAEAKRLLGIGEIHA